MKVSIIMGTFNGENTITKAIESILNQTYKDFELIICDDASTDNTYKLLLDLEKRDSRLKIIHNLSNLKLAASLNNCLKIAEGEYIARMDDDDISLVNRIEEQVIYLNQNPDITFCGSNVYYFDNNGVFGKSSLVEYPKLIDVFKASQFIHPTVMMRKKALLEVGGYTANSITRRCEDYDLWCKFYFKGYTGFNMPLYLLNYFESRKSMIKRKKIHRWELYKIKKYWRKKMNLPLYFNFYAYLEIFKMFVPNELILIFHQKSMGAQNEL